MSSQNQAYILSMLAESAIQVMPNLTTENIQSEVSLHDLGANSIDRAEILMLTMAALQLKMPMLKFAQAKNIGDIVAIFNDHLEIAAV